MNCDICEHVIDPPESHSRIDSQDYCTDCFNDLFNTSSFKPSLGYQLRAVCRARYGVEGAVNDLTNLLLDIYPKGHDWDGDELDEVRSELQEIDEKIGKIVKQLKDQGADVEQD
jgi:hypothetical protein